MIYPTLYGTLRADITPETRRFDFAIIVVATLVFFALNVDFLLYGDAALYGDYALRRKFTEVTLHLGYYWLLIGVQATIGNVLHLPMHETMVWVNVVVGALTMGVAYLLGLELLKSRRDALITVLILLFSGRVINNATSSEMYMPQLLGVLLSFLLFARSQIVAAGFVAGVALLISPLSAFAYLFFPVFDYQRTGRIRWLTLVTLTAAAAVVYVPYLVVYGHDLFWGVRGLLKINALDRANPSATGANFPKYQFKQFTFLLLLLVPALRATRRHLRFFVLAAAVAIPHLYVILKLTGEDNVFILNTDFFFAAVLAIGWCELADHRRDRWAGPVLLASHVGVYVASGLLFAFEANRGYAAESREFARTYLTKPTSVVITDWGTGVALTYFARPFPSTSILKEPLFQKVYDIEAPPEVNPSLAAATDIYLIDRWKPLPLSRFFRTDGSIREQYQLHSVLLVAERTLGVHCSLLQERTNKQYHCVMNRTVAKL